MKCSNLYLVLGQVCMISGCLIAAILMTAQNVKIITVESIGTFVTLILLQALFYYGASIVMSIKGKDEEA